MSSVIRISKGELAHRISARNFGVTRDVANDAIDAVIAEIRAAVAAGERVVIQDFGTFERRDRAARTARNPQTGEPIDVEATKAPAFKAAKAFKDQVSGAAKNAA
jgi:DNA-binding protein HU-beta